MGAGSSSSITSFIRMEIRHNISRIRRAFGALGKDIEKTGKSAKRAGTEGASGFAKMTGAVISLKSLTSGLIITFAGFQVVNAIRKWTAEISNFQDEFANVTTLVDTSIVSVDSMRKEVLSLGGTLGSATDLTKGLYQALSAGVEPARAVEFVGTAAKFAQAALTDTLTSVDVLTTILNAYGLEASQAAAVSDDLFEIIKQGKTTGQELAAALGRVIPTAAVLKVNLKELGAALATMTKGGLNTNEAVTALNQGLLTFLKPQAKAVKLSKEMGIELNRETIERHGLFGALKLLSEKTEEYNKRTGKGSEATAILFGNIRALKAILALTGPQAKEFENILGEMQNTTGNTDIAFQKMSQTIGFQFKAAMNNVVRLFISTSDEMSSVTKALITFNNFMEKGIIPINNFVIILGVLAASLAFAALSTVLVSEAIAAYTISVFVAETATAAWGTVMAVWSSASAIKFGFATNALTLANTRFTASLALAAKALLTLNFSMFVRVLGGIATGILPKLSLAIKALIGGQGLAGLRVAFGKTALAASIAAGGTTKFSAAIVIAMRRLVGLKVALKASLLGMRTFSVGATGMGLAAVRLQLIGLAGAFFPILTLSIMGAVKALGFFTTALIVIGVGVAAFALTRLFLNWTKLNEPIQDSIKWLGIFQGRVRESNIQLDKASVRNATILYEQYGVMISRIGKTQQEYNDEINNTLRDLTRLNQMLPRNAALWGENEAAIAAILDKDKLLNTAIDTIIAAVARSIQQGMTAASAWELQRDAIVNVNEAIKKFEIDTSKMNADLLPEWTRNTEKITERQALLTEALAALDKKALAFGVTQEALSQKLLDFNERALVPEFVERYGKELIDLGKFAAETGMRLTELEQAAIKMAIQSEASAKAALKLSDAFLTFGVEQEALIQEMTDFVDGGGSIVDLIKVLGPEIINLGKFALQTGKDLSVTTQEIISQAIQADANAKAQGKLSTALLTAGVEAQATANAIGAYLEAGGSAEVVSKLFSKELLALAKSSKVTKLIISDKTQALIANTEQMKANMEAMKRVTKAEQEIEDAYKDSQAALAKLTLEGIENKEALRDQVAALIRAADRAVDWADSMKQADKVLESYDKELKGNERLTVKWAKTVQIASDELEAFTKNTKAGRTAFITTNELFDELGITQVRSTEATDALLQKLIQLGEEGGASARQVSEGWITAFRGVIDASEQMSPAYLEQLKKMVFDTDIQIGKQAREVWAEYIENIKRMGGTLPPAWEEINRRLREENERATKDFAADWEEQVSTIVTDFSSGVADMILDAKGFTSVVTGIFKEFAKGVIRTFIEQLFDPLNSLFKGFASGLNDLFTGIGKSIAGFFGKLFGGGGVASLANPGTAFGGIGLGSLPGLGGGLGGGVAGGAAGGAGGGAAAGAFSAKALAFMTNPITIAVAGAIAGGFLIWKKFIKKDAFKSGAKEVGRDFGIAMSKGVVDSFVKTLDITKKEFEGIRKDILSSPKFLEDVLIPAAQAEGSIEALIASFARLEAFGKTFDLSAPLRKAIDSGDFQTFNKAWFDIFKNSEALVEVFGDDIPAALFGTGRAIEDIIEGLEELIEKTGLTKEFTDAFIDGFNDLSDTLEEIPQQAANLAGQFEGLITFLTGNGIDALDAQSMAWEEFGGAIIETFNQMTMMGIEIPPFIQQLIDWAFANEELGFTMDGLAQALEFAETAAGELVTEFEILIEEFNETGIISQRLADIIGEAGGNLADFQAAAKIGGLTEFKGEIDSLKKSIDALLPKQKAWHELFLETGELSKEAAKNIKEAGGNIEDFENFSEIKTVQEEFNRLVAEMDETGRVSKDLLNLLIEFGGPSVAQSMQFLLDKLMNSGGQFLELGDISSGVLSSMQAGVIRTSEEIERKFITAGRTISSELGDISASLIETINAMKDALLDAIAEVVAAITGIPRDIEIVTTHKEIFEGGAPPPPPEFDPTANNINPNGDIITDPADPRYDPRLLPDFGPGNRADPLNFVVNPDGTIDTRFLPQNALGGIATKPTVGIFGEAEAEALIPLSKLPELIDSKSGKEESTTVIFEKDSINLSALDASGLEEMVQERLVPMITDSISRNISGANESFKDSLDI